MTREEAIHIFENSRLVSEYFTPEAMTEVYVTALTALRPVSLEQVEKMKKEPVEGEYDELYAPTYKCPECGFENIGGGNFCRNCGCLHTDEAVEMVMERMEELKDATD